MPALLRLALQFCPRSFRREYEAQIVEDARDARWSGTGNLLFLCFNVAWSGVLLQLEIFSKNCAFAVRSLVKSRAYAVVAIATIALAIGMNVAVASVLEGVLFRPLPFPHAGQLYAVSQHGAYGGWSYLNAHEYAARSKTVASLGLAADDAATLRGRGRPVLLGGKQVDEGYFSTLGVAPELGRYIGASDGGKNVAVISDELWRKYFDADPGAIGKRVNLSGTLYTIVGVTPPAFRDPSLGTIDRGAYWIPDDMPARHVRFRGDSAAFVRLQPGTNAQAATADLHRVVADLDRRYPNPALVKPQPGTVVPLLSTIVGPVKPLLWLLYSAVSILLLIACVNVANLALVRAASRERELVVRSALGASRTNIAVQLCTESGMLCALGGILGAVLAWALLQAFAAFGAHMLPRWESVSPDGALIAYVVAIVVCAALLVGVLPALWIRRDIATALKSAGRGGDRSASKGVRSALVIAEVALAIAVVISAGLIVRSFVALTHSPLGFDPTNVSVDMRSPGLPMGGLDFAQRVRSIDRLLGALHEIPGVTAVAGSHWVPFSPSYLEVPASIPAHSPSQSAVAFNTVTLEYFQAFHIPLLAGRNFANTDSLNARPVAIVSAGLARKYFGSIRNAVGSTVFPKMDIGGNSVVPRTVVGVVGDARSNYATPPQPQIYAAMSQFPLMFSLVLRTDGRNAGLGKAVDDVFARYEPDVAQPVMAPYSTLLANDSMNAHVAALLFGTFALVALLLSLAGVYAVTAYAVEQRTQEFGIRRAIGAGDIAVVRDVLARALIYGAIGIAIGLALAAAGTRSVAPLLFETSPLDPATFGAVIVLMLGCSILAALLPALRATRITPIEALRYE